MNYRTVSVGMDVRKGRFSLYCYTNEKKRAEYPQKAMSMAVYPERTRNIVCAGLTRERMAQHPGMNRSALSRLLCPMQRKGWIELRRGGIRLLSRTISNVE